MYATGQGVNKNIPEALKWLKKAAAGEDKQAIQMLQMLGGEAIEST